MKNVLKVPKVQLIFVYLKRFSSLAQELNKERKQFNNALKNGNKNGKWCDWHKLASRQWIHPFLLMLLGDGCCLLVVVRHGYDYGYGYDLEINFGFKNDFHI